MRISEIMRKEFLCIEPDDTLASAVKKLVGSGLSEAPVMGEGKFRGMFCTSDIAAALVRHEILNTKPLQADAPKAGGEMVIKHIKSTRAWLAPEADIFSAFLLLVHHNIETLPVLDKSGRVLGVVRGADLRNEMLLMFANSSKKLEEEKKGTFEKVGVALDAVAERRFGIAGKQPPKQENVKKAAAQDKEVIINGTTAIDQLVNFVRQSGAVSAAEAAKRCNLTVGEVEAYSLSLEKNGILKIEYDMLGNMKLQKHI